MGVSTWPFTRAQWFALPLRLRQRWWRETDFSTREPSPELRALVLNSLGADHEAG